MEGQCGLLQRAAINEPTWTGHSGAAGAPAARPRFGTAVNPALRDRLAPQAADASRVGEAVRAPLQIHKPPDSVDVLP